LAAVKIPLRLRVKMVVRQRIPAPKGGVIIANALNVLVVRINVRGAYGLASRIPIAPDQCSR
jgi:hypothetical protein